MGAGGIRMEKEKVLEIEFQPVWDKWAWKVTKQNEEILKRGIFEDYDIGVLSTYFPDFYYHEKLLYIRGTSNSKDNKINICSSEEKELIEEKAKAINEKYGILKRWRAIDSGWYYYINNSYSSIIFAIDHRFEDDNKRYEGGNYFFTEKEAQEYAEYMKKKSLEWHEKRDNNG